MDMIEHNFIIKIYANYKHRQMFPRNLYDKPNSTAQGTQVKRHTASPSCTISPDLSSKRSWLRKQSLALELEPDIINWSSCSQ